MLTTTTCHLISKPNSSTLGKKKKNTCNLYSPLLIYLVVSLRDYFLAEVSSPFPLSSFPMIAC